MLNHNDMDDDVDDDINYNGVDDDVDYYVDVDVVDENVDDDGFDEPAHRQNLTRAFTFHIHKVCK